MRSESVNPAATSAPTPRMVGRYLMYDEIASGGMASVHFGRLFAAVGFSRMVAIKRLHPHYSSDAEFISMFLDEARLAARIQHPNVAAPLDVVLEESGEIFLVMEYIHGETLVRLIGNARLANLTIPFSVSASIMSGALRGLHAAHEAVNEAGSPLGIIHRDVSPQNIMVGVDGVARVLDFGVAKAVSRSQSTRQGHLKGKLSYMAPEQMRSGPVDRRVDIFAAGIVLWEALTQRRLFKPDDPASAFAMILSSPIQRPSAINPEVPAALDGVAMKALDRDVTTRFQTALDFADALEEAISLASPRKVGEWVERLCGKQLAQRADRVSEIELSSYDPDSAKNAEELLRSKRGSIPVGTVDPTASTAEQGSAGRPRIRTYQSGLSRREIPPSPSPDVPSNDVPTARKTWQVVVALSVVVLLLGTGAVYLLRRPGSTARRGAMPAHVVPTVPSVPSEQTPAVQPTAPAVVEAPAVEPGVANQDEISPASTPPKAAKDEHRRRAASSRVRHGAKAKPVPAKAFKTTSPGGKKNCDPPYYIDYQGIRRVKPQCL